MSLRLSQASLDRVAEALAHYPAEHKRAALLPILHIVQEEKGFVPEGMEDEIAATVGVPVVKVKEVLSFYTWFLHAARTSRDDGLPGKEAGHQRRRNLRRRQIFLDRRGVFGLL